VDESKGEKMQQNSTPPEKMATATLVAEHAGLNDAIDNWNSNSQRTTADVQQQKRRKLLVKCELLRRANSRDSSALEYALYRNWELTSSALEQAA